MMKVAVAVPLNVLDSNIEVRPSLERPEFGPKCTWMFLLVFNFTLVICLM